MPLQPANVDEPFAVAKKVALGLVPPGALNVMFEAHVLVTCLRELAVPVPPHDTGARTVCPGRTVIVTDPRAARRQT